MSGGDGGPDSTVSPLLVPQLAVAADLMPCGFGGCPLPGRVSIVTWTGFVLTRCQHHARRFACWPPDHVLDIDWSHFDAPTAGVAGQRLFGQ